MPLARPHVDDVARAALDALAIPVTVASSVRDRDGRLLDFRIEFDNRAAAAWAGLPAGGMGGHLLTDLIPGMRAIGLWDTLVEVVTTGLPFRQREQPYEAAVDGGRAFAGVFDLAAIRLGDGYASAWSERPAPGLAAPDLEAALREVARLVPILDAG
ncbi:MAG TPA: hypothetical protein VGI98_07605 [Candidatus Limnocylindrales bacterium]|jgi:hypothetical protein